MKKIFTLLLATIFISVFSQTKLIFYKSHSGNMKNFSADAIDISDGNLGLPPERIVGDIKLDSVIYVNDKETMLVSTYCTTRYGERKEEKHIRKIVPNSRLNFTKNQDSIKSLLKSNLYFDEFLKSVDDAVFIGFDKPTKKEMRKLKKEQKKSLKADKSTSENSEKNHETPYYLGLIFLTSLAGVYSWKKNKK